MPTRAVAAYALRPSWRGWIHAVAAMLAVPGAVLLVATADHPMAKFAATIYGLGIVLGFGTSACYHRLAWSDRSHKILRRMDHSMIFVLIAGTYTPVCLVALPKAWGIPLFVVVWTGAITGIVLKQVAFDRFRVVQHALYPMLGWAAVVSLPALVHSLSGPALALLLSGGLLYTFGIPVLARRRPDPWPRIFGYHEIWHAATVLAGVCHFVMIALVVT